MSTRAVIIPIIQRGIMDCGLCCLQMLLDRPYDEIVDAAMKVRPNLHRDGMTVYALQLTGKRLGLNLMRRVFTADDDAPGILQIKLKKTRGYHYVVRFNDVFINPADGMVWDQDIYLANKGRATALLVVAE